MNKKILFWFCLFMLFSELFGSNGHRHFHKKLKKVQKKILMTEDDSDEDVFLRITKPMKDQNATSGGNVQFKCRVDGWPRNSMHYTWYKDDAMIDMSLDPRVNVKTRLGGSKLTLMDVFTVDSGLYRCEASNGHRRVHTTAKLTVFFERPPPRKDNKPKLKIPAGKCEKYGGLVCGQYLNDVSIFVDSFESQEEKENLIKNALKNISNSSFTSPTCEKFTLPAFCHFIFTPCHVDANGATKRGERLCREDCQLLKRDICHNEFTDQSKNSVIKTLFNSANCSYLPSAKNSDCVRIGVAYPVTDPICYTDKGMEYRGKVNEAESGEKCQTWPSDMARKHPELLGGHSFCRNPGNLMEKPWCYIDPLRTQKVLCDMELCDISNGMGGNLIILISSASGVILLIFGVVLCCVKSIRRKRICKSATFEKKADHLQPHVVLLKNEQGLQQHSSLRINLSSMKLLADIGSGEYGKVYKGSIIDDPRFCEKQPFAFKVLDSCHVTSKVEAFKREMEVLSKLQHPSITNLKAFTFESNTKVLAFEFTHQVNLQEHLVINSRLSQSSKSLISSTSKQGISSEAFIKWAFQIASGMEYLSSNNYIHRDLAARNVLVCGNMDLKISTLEVVRDSYLSSYHKTPEGLLMPIRWMAPESLQCWQFSDKSTVWSFGVLLWEMFSYGLQPYCGYSNHEVLDVISRRQLLSCPDQCPANIYSLMLECWNDQPSKRPFFFELRDMFQNLLKNNSFVQTPLFTNDANTIQPPPYHPKPVPNHWEATISASERSQLLEFERYRQPN